MVDTAEVIIKEKLDRAEKHYTQLESIAKHVAVPSQFNAELSSAQVRVRQEIYSLKFELLRLVSKQKSTAADYCKDECDDSCAEDDS